MKLTTSDEAFIASDTSLLSLLRTRCVCRSSLETLGTASLYKRWLICFCFVRSSGGFAALGMEQVSDHIHLTPLLWSCWRLQVGMSIIYLYILSGPFLAASANLHYSCGVLSVREKFGQGSKKAVLNGAL